MIDLCFTDLERLELVRKQRELAAEKRKAEQAAAEAAAAGRVLFSFPTRSCGCMLTCCANSRQALSLRMLLAVDALVCACLYFLERQKPGKLYAAGFYSQAYEREGSY